MTFEALTLNSKVFVIDADIGEIYSNDDFESNVFETGSGPHLFTLGQAIDFANSEDFDILGYIRQEEEGEIWLMVRSLPEDEVFPVDQNELLEDMKPIPNYIANLQFHSSLF